MCVIFARSSLNQNYIPVGAIIIATTNPMDFKQEDTMEKILAFAGVFSLVYTIALLRVSFGA